MVGKALMIVMFQDCFLIMSCIAVIEGITGVANATSGLKELLLGTLHPSYRITLQAKARLTLSDFLCTWKFQSAAKRVFKPPELDRVPAQYRTLCIISLN